jgi:ribosomal protein S18 acetylase RimI-like enzyme
MSLRQHEVVEREEQRTDSLKLVQQVGALKKRAYGEGDITDMWYISHLAISPQWQGKGVGAALMRHFMDKIGGEQCTLLAVEEGLVSDAFRGHESVALYLYALQCR